MTAAVKEVALVALVALVVRAATMAASGVTAIAATEAAASRRSSEACSQPRPQAAAQSMHSPQASLRSHTGRTTHTPVLGRHVCRTTRRPPHIRTASLTRRPHPPCMAAAPQVPSHRRRSVRPRQANIRLAADTPHRRRAGTTVFRRRCTTRQGNPRCQRSYRTPRTPTQAGTRTVATRVKDEMAVWTAAVEAWAVRVTEAAKAAVERVAADSESVQTEVAE